MAEMPNYQIGKTIFGNSAAIEAAYNRFCTQKIDEIRLNSDKSSSYPLMRQGLLGEASVAGVGTFEGSSKQTITFAPSSKPGWWIRRMDQPEQLDTKVDIANLWTSAQNLVLRSGSPHNYLRMQSSHHLVIYLIRSMKYHHVAKDDTKLLDADIECH